MTKHSRDRNSLLMKSVAVLGASATGKSSLVARFLGKPFEEQHQPTVEDYHSGKIYSGETLCQFDITDTSGTFEFPAMEKLTMEKADGFIFVYSIEDAKSFERVKSCLRKLSEVRDIRAVPVVVVCNKADLEDITMLRELQMRIDHEEVHTGLRHKGTDEVLSITNQNKSDIELTLSSQRDHVLRLGCTFLLTSAKLRWNVNRIFQQLFATRESDKEVGKERTAAFGKSRALSNKMKFAWKKVQLGGQ